MTDSEAQLMTPDFDKVGGLIPAIAQDAESGRILMMAYMNPEAFQKTLETGEVHYWSRSRQVLWHKGGTSGHVQKLKDIYLDCDGDAIVVIIEQVGKAACHTGHESCFHFHWNGKEFREEGEIVFNPEEVYGK